MRARGLLLNLCTLCWEGFDDSLCRSMSLQVTMAWIRACQHALRQAPKELLLSAAPYLSLRNGRGTVEGVALQQMFVSQVGCPWLNPVRVLLAFAAEVPPLKSASLLPNPDLGLVQPNHCKAALCCRGWPSCKHRQRFVAKACR